MWRTQATTESPAFARAGSCERPNRRNADAELPSSFLDIAGVAFPLKKSRTRAPGCRTAHGTIWGAQGSRVRLTDGLARTKKTPTSVPASQPTQTPTRFISCGSRPFGGRLASPRPNLLVVMQSQKVSDQCGVSPIRPESFDYSRARLSSLIKDSLSSFLGTVSCRLAGRFYDIRQQGMYKLPKFAQQPFLRMSRAHLFWNIS